MADTLTERQGVRVLLCDPDGARLGTAVRYDHDLADLIGEALRQRVELIAARWPGSTSGSSP